jgi:NAD(P)-dependent dehydrogenase (short-subunit alcohol dehydrogenase family)
LTIAVVTGGARGIGYAVACRLARDGARVAILDVDEVAGRRAAQELGASFVRCDVGLASEVDAAFAEIAARLGPVRTLVNNAGLNARFDVVGMAEAEWDRLLAVDLKAAWLCARRVVPDMRQRDGGAIVNVASIHADLTRPGFFPYAAAKAGLTGLTRTMALELGPDDIRVNAVCPGVVRAGLVLERFAEADDAGEVERRMCELQPLGRIGEPDDIASVVAFLASDEAAFVTGAAWAVDGGLGVRFAHP